MKPAPRHGAVPAPALTMPWGVRFAPTTLGVGMVAFKGKRVTIIDDDGIPRRVTGAITSCPTCCCCPCTCDRDAS